MHLAPNSILYLSKPNPSLETFSITDFLKSLSATQIKFIRKTFIKKRKQKKRSSIYLDKASREHSIKVAIISNWLAESMQLPIKERKNILLAALFHDIGKAYPSVRKLLNVKKKYSEVTQEEKKEHVLKAKQTLHALLAGKRNIFSRKETELLTYVTEFHHYYLNGEGYATTENIPKEELPQAVFMVVLADSLEAAISLSRRYRKPITVEEFLTQSLSGEMIKRFDSDLVPIFKTILEKNKEVFLEMLEKDYEKFRLFFKNRKNNLLKNNFIILKSA
ncbi:HD-GYP domain-containing protein [Candidatus Auribacterota bacterium]